MKIIPIILAGGSGSRLWPLSRKKHPKQYLSLISKNTMLQETIFRLKGIKNIGDPIVVCNSENRFLTKDQCKKCNIKNLTIIIEPVGKNTAPAITAAALYSLKKIKDATLLVLSADHFIQDVEAFHEAINVAVQHAQDKKIVIFGISPNKPSVEYGYVKHSKVDVKGAFIVEEFIEKPSIQKAKRYLKQKNYLWNCGIFIFKAKTIIDELITYAPEMVSTISDSVNNSRVDLDFICLEERAFKLSKSGSIDYVLMEKSTNVLVVPLNVKWNDVGTWLALRDIGKKDKSGNVVNGDVIYKNSSNNYINATHRMLVTIGINNLIVVETADVIFIAKDDALDNIKTLLDSLNKKKRAEYEIHRKVFRPWGWYDIIEKGENFQVKKLHINPGSKLSLQMHRKRAEHWVVITGTASVINGKNTLTLYKGDSTYIPISTIHSLENKTNESLEIIEVQSGNYLGEDDIKRFEDIYGRL